MQSLQERHIAVGSGGSNRKLSSVPVVFDFQTQHEVPSRSLQPKYAVLLQILANGSVAIQKPKCHGRRRTMRMWQCVLCGSTLLPHVWPEAQRAAARAPAAPAAGPAASRKKEAGAAWELSHDRLRECCITAPSFCFASRHCWQVCAVASCTNDSGIGQLRGRAMLAAAKLLPNFRGSWGPQQPALRCVSPHTLDRCPLRSVAPRRT